MMALDLNATPPPHCDQAVLHAPGECKYCDEVPDWQELRKLWGIAFTGHAPKDREVPCPSDARRGPGVAHLWPNNRPSQGDPADLWPNALPDQRPFRDRVRGMFR
jgi:hypothetical protein